MQRIKYFLLAIAFAIITLTLFVAALPLIIIASPIAWIKRKKYKKKYVNYLLSIDGANFFCYNNRKKGLKYIEERIVPNLPDEVEVLFLNGRKIESKKYDSKFLSDIFYGFKNYSRFPQLLKIRNGEAIDCSLNPELFNSLNKTIDENAVFSKMNEFFQLKENTKQP